jgi:hypothetical protein
MIFNLFSEEHYFIYKLFLLSKDQWEGKQARKSPKIKTKMNFKTIKLPNKESFPSAFDHSIINRITMKGIKTIMKAIRKSNMLKQPSKL